jgi:ssDNA-binding Zn-finger/Zn-ribbon topoisomerase 1
MVMEQQVEKKEDVPIEKNGDVSDDITTPEDYDVYLEMVRAGKVSVPEPPEGVILPTKKTTKWLMCKLYVTCSECPGFQFVLDAKGYTCVYAGQAEADIKKKADEGYECSNCMDKAEKKVFEEEGLHGLIVNWEELAKELENGEDLQNAVIKTCSWQVGSEMCKYISAEKMFILIMQSGWDEGLARMYGEHKEAVEKCLDGHTRDLVMQRFDSHMPHRIEEEPQETQEVITPPVVKEEQPSTQTEVQQRPRKFLF